MQKQAENVTINYEPIDEECAKLLADKLCQKLPELFDFFGIDGFSSPKSVYIYPSIESYKEYKLTSSGHYEDWMIAEQRGNELRFLSHRECIRLESHADQTESGFCKLVVHELVHACQRELYPDELAETEWFDEAIATALAEQHEPIDIFCTYDDLLHHLENIDRLYETFFTVGAYMLERLPRDTIRAYTRDPSALLRDGEALLADAIEWSRRTQHLEFVL